MPLSQLPVGSKQSAEGSHQRQQSTAASSKQRRPCGKPCGRKAGGLGRVVSGGRAKLVWAATRMHALLPITLAIVHAHEGMRFGIKTWLEQAGVAKVVLEQECPKGLLAALSPGGVQVLLLFVDHTLQLALDTAAAVRRRFAGTAVLLVAEWTEPLLGRTLAVEVQGLLHSATRLEEIAKAVVVSGNDGVYVNVPMRLRRKMERSPKKEHPGTVKLTQKELELLALICRADEPTYVQIAVELNRSVRTVESHRDNLFAKFKVNTRGQLKDAARAQGLLPPR